MKKKVFVLVLCMQIVVSSLAGCSNKKSIDTNNAATITPSEEQTLELTKEAIDPKEAGLSSIFPLKEKITLTYYIKENDAMAATMETYGDVEYFKELEKKTNVHIEWNHNTSDESFALMIAGGELPDLINWPLSSAAGGVQALLDDDVILDLTEMVPKYAPNYYAWLQANPEVDKSFRLDDGTYYQLGSFNADWDTMDMTYFSILGPQIRQDWLVNLGLEMPKTTDELYEVLTAFKNNDCNNNGDPNDEIPYVITGGEQGLGETMYSLAGSFGTRKDFYMQDGEIVFGPITDNYKKYLTYMNKLYTEGLINSDFAVNQDAFNFILQDIGGFTINAMGSGVVAGHDLLKTKNSAYNYVSTPWLIGPDGDQCTVSDHGGTGRTTAITTSCKYPEIALEWLDYAYSYEGSLNSTFGVEGKSYEIIDDYPTIIEEVKQNDKGWGEEESMCRWMLGSVNYPNARDFRFYEQVNLNEDYKRDIQTNWSVGTDNITMPPLVFSTEEASTYSQIMADVNTYVGECSLKFIIGQMDFEEDWDTYVQNTENMSLEEAGACKLAAFERYQSR